MLIAVPVLLVAALTSRARQSILESQATAEQDALEQIQRALVNSDGQSYHVQIAIDFPATYQFPLSLTISDAASTTGHFSVSHDGAVTEERPQ